MQVNGKLSISRTNDIADEPINDIGMLRTRVVNSLIDQGFVLQGSKLVLPGTSDKAALRIVHTAAVQHRVEKARPGLVRHENQLLSRIANGSEVQPLDVRPRLVEVTPDSEDELLFRYARLHWSIPVSAGYGRRIRFLVVDEANDKLIGLFGLGDPVYSLGPRDRWIGWDKETKRRNLRKVMDAFVLGSVPPYSSLLFGKLIALLVSCNEVREAVHRKYAGQQSRISGHSQDGELALVTTTSALGRSSVYNRLRYRGEQSLISVGYTQGSGEFHFSNGIYRDLRAFALEHCDATGKDSRWGIGFRNRRELIRKVLPKIGLSADMVYHGVKREIFLAPLAANTPSYLSGESDNPQWHDRSADELFDWFRTRWLMPRASSDQRYRLFERESYRIWEH